MSLKDDARLSRQMPDAADAKTIRVNAGISVTRFAQELGVHPNTVCRWESGTRRPRGQMRIAYAAALADLSE